MTNQVVAGVAFENKVVARFFQRVIEQDTQPGDDQMTVAKELLKAWRRVIRKGDDLSDELIVKVVFTLQIPVKLTPV